MSEKYVFWMYAIAMTICLVYSITEMPETKGKTLQVIFNWFTTYTILSDYCKYSVDDVMFVKWNFVFEETLF